MRNWLMGWGIVICALLSAVSSFAADDRPEIQLSLERTLVQQGGLLLRPGQLEVEPSFEYSFFSTRRIEVSGFSVLPTLVIGVIETNKVQRNILEPSVTFRLGVVRDVQAEVRVPYRFAFDRVSTQTTETTTEDNGIGDVEAAVFYQPLKEQGWIPDLIVGVRGKSTTGKDPFGLQSNEIPTGTGFYSVTGTVTAVKSSDPAVIFGGLLYTYNIGRTVQVASTDTFMTKIYPGYSVGYNIGLGLAISIDLAFNMRFEQRFVSGTDTEALVAGAVRSAVPGSTLTVASVFFGITWAITQNMSADFSAGIGLTEDSPDATVRVAFPIRFSDVFSWLKT